MEQSSPLLGSLQGTFQGVNSVPILASPTTKASPLANVGIGKGGLPNNTDSQGAYTGSRLAGRNSPFSPPASLVFDAPREDDRLDVGGDGHQHHHPLLGKNATNSHAERKNGHFRPWTSQQRRAYQRIKTGLKWHHGEGLRLKFITVTMPDNATQDGLRRGWHALKMRIGRMTPLRLVEGGYLRVQQLHHFYPGKPLGEPLRFEYWKVETREGNGVFHIIFYGDYIPQAWLSEVWESLTGAWNVDIRTTKRKVGNDKRLASYCVSQYVAGQDAFVRYSWGWAWAYKGFCGVWNRLSKYLKEIKPLDYKPWQIAIWDTFVAQHRSLEEFLPA